MGKVMKSFQKIIARLVVCLLCTPAVAGEPNQLNFATPKHFTVAGDLEAIAVGDFNADRRPDIVVANISGVVSVLLGNGDGTFQSAVPTNVRGALVSAAVGDFNGDRKLDVAGAELLHSTEWGSLESGSIWILLGKGNGQFEAPISYEAENYWSSVAVGDFNRDGKLDLAVTSIITLQGNRGPGSVVVLLGKGDGSFQDGTYYQTGIDPTAVAVSDFNGDKNPDLAVAYDGTFGHDYGGITILLGNRDGTFSATSSNYPSGGRPASIVTGDFNGDRRSDFAVANFDTASVSVFLGMGNGIFLPARTFPAGLNSCCSIASMDFDCDGKLDLAVADFSGATANVLVGDGRGMFKQPVAFDTAGNCEWLTASDLNRDHRPDLALINPDGKVTILLNTAKKHRPPHGKAKPHGSNSRW